MLNYHYFILDSPDFGSDTHIFNVGIGRGRQADSDYLYLTAFAADHGHYFELKSEKSSTFVLRFLKEYGIPQANVHCIKARDLVRALKAGEACPVPAINQHAAHEMRKNLDLNYRIFCNLSKRDFHLLSNTRKKPL